MEASLLQFYAPRDPLAEVLAGLRGALPPEALVVSIVAGKLCATIERALRAHGKPRMALEAVEAMAAAGSPGVPRLLASVVEKVVRLAREAR